MENNLNPEPLKTDTNPGFKNTGSIFGNKKQLALWAAATLLVLAVLGLIIWRMVALEPEEGGGVIEKDFPVEEIAIEASQFGSPLPGEFSVTGGILQLHFIMRDEGDNIITLEPLRASQVRTEVKYPGETIYYRANVHNQTELVFPLWPPMPAGTVFVRIHNEDGTIFETTFEWPGVGIIENADVLRGESSVTVEFPDFDLAQAERIFYMTPSGTIQEFDEEFASSTFTISTQAIESGNHTLLVKMPNDDRWHSAVPTYPEDFQ